MAVGLCVLLDINQTNWFVLGRLLSSINEDLQGINFEKAFYIAYVNAKHEEVQRNIYSRQTV